MVNEYLEITLRLIIALGIGSLVGIERTYHGRPAGFRTHTLVCLSASMLMLLTVYGGRLFPLRAMEYVSIDPTRMAQGIMTGIGFLGAGMIMREGITVRGLTTAASIWVTTAIGILVGVGFYFPAGLAAVMVLGILSIFRWLEHFMIPSYQYSQFSIQFNREATMTESELYKFLDELSFSVANINYRLLDGKYFEYRMMLRTRQSSNVRHLSEALIRTPIVVEFSISPTGD